MGKVPMDGDQHCAGPKGIDHTLRVNQRNGRRFARTDFGRPPFDFAQGREAPPFTTVKVST